MTKSSTVLKTILQNHIQFGIPDLANADLEKVKVNKVPVKSIVYFELEGTEPYKFAYGVDSDIYFLKDKKALTSTLEILHNGGDALMQGERPLRLAVMQ